jgi:hypothetical protein
LILCVLPAIVIAWTAVVVGLLSHYEVPKNMKLSLLSVTSKAREANKTSHFLVDFVEKAPPQPDHSSDYHFLVAPAL